MAWTFHHLGLQAKNSGMILAIKAKWVLFGGVILDSGDAFGTYGNGTDVLTHDGTGAGGANNPGAWFRAGYNHPVYGWFEWTWQRGTTNTNGRVKFSWIERFTTGAGQATTPSSTTEHIKIGAGTDAAPTYAAWTPTVDNNSQLHILYESTLGLFMAFTHRNGAQDGTDMVFFLDQMAPGTFRTQDVVPSLAYWSATGSTSLEDSSLCDEGAGPTAAWIKKGLGGAVVNVPAAKYRTGSLDVTPFGEIVDAYTGKAPLKPLIWLRRAALTAPQGSKGRSQLLRWVGPNYDTINGSGKSTGTRFQVVNAGDYLLIGHVAVVWDNTALNPDPSGGATATAFLDEMFTNFDLDPPVVGPPTPASTSTVDRLTAITFPVSDLSNGLRRVAVYVKQGAGALLEVAYDGTTWQPGWSNASSRTGAATNYAFTLRPDAGWAAGPITVEVVAIDLGGNETVATWTFNLAAGVAYPPPFTGGSIGGLGLGLD